MVNVAEMVIEPFWDRQMSGIRKWEIKNFSYETSSTNWWERIPESIYAKEPVFCVESEDDSGLWMKETWSQLEFGCRKADIEYTALEMTRDFHSNCSNYDNLLLCGLIPPKATLVLTAVTDAGEFSETFTISEDAYKKEYALSIKGLMLLTVKIQIIFSKDYPGNGFLHWLMLRNSSLEKAYIQSMRVEDANWEPWLKDDSYEPSFTPFLGISTDEKNIADLRENKELVQMFTKAAYEMKEPEQIISDYVNFGQDKRFARERDYEKYFENVEDIATAALLAKDPVLVKKAARYALSIASCHFWQDSFMCRSIGLPFDHKAFVESICCRVIATIIDLVGEMFTNAGIQFLLRRLCEEGLANINWVVWKYAQPPEDIFTMNQLAWFSSGRLAAYVVVERFWKGVSQYTDLAYDELCRSINMIVLPDGGYDEGPGYFTAAARFAGMGLHWYARARGKSFSEVIPQNLSKAVDFAECILSLDEHMPFIPVGDSHIGKPGTYSVLAALMPESHWTTLFRKLWEQDGEECTDLLTIQLEKSIPLEGPAYRNYISMPDWGGVASVRELDGEKIKILHCGGNAGANHGHQDKGSFVVQFAGETIFADPGIGSYDDYIGSSMGRIQWHNMLIPLVKDKIIEPYPPSKDIKPISKGNDISFHSRMELTACWEGIFKHWSRDLDSEQPDSLRITDTYLLENADSVMLNLVTPLFVTIEEEYVIITGKKSKVVIKPNQNSSIELIALPEYRGSKYTCITMKSNGTEGTIKTEIKFNLNKGVYNNV